jgi:hypothetical protein
MLSIANIAFAVLLLTNPGGAAQNDGCSAASSASDVLLALALKEGRTTFQEGEIIPLVLSFTSTTKNRYWADVRTYDRSGRLGIEYYCVAPEAPDPLASYFKVGAFIGGGLGNTRELSDTPFTAEAELNEWRRLGPGHYRVFAISYRVWRPPDPSEQTAYGRVSEVVRSNTVELEVNSADANWQDKQLRDSTQTLAGAPSPDDSRRAARRLRFLNTQDSTRQLARLFWGLNQQQPAGWDLMFGLYGSPYRKLAIDSMHDQLAAPDHAITSEFLSTLVNLQVSADPAWELADRADPEAAQGFWERRQAHTQALTKVEIEMVVAALPRKVRSARALTLNGLLMAGGWDQTIAKTIRPALIAAWTDLPNDTQRELIQYRWPLIAGPEMLPILRRMVTEPPPLAQTDIAMTRDAALKHIQELDPAAGRALILRDALDRNAQPSLEVIKLLPKEDIAVVLQPAVERVGHNEARDLDYELLDRFADVSVLGIVQPAFEEHLGKWACAPQSAMLRYFLRVEPVYGAKQVNASLRARKDTHCYSNLLQSLGRELPKAEKSAIEALDDSDPELVQDAVLALGRWGSADAEAALWARLRRFHQDWVGREGQLRMTPDHESRGSRGAALEQELVSAIAGGSSWICPPDKLARIAELVSTKRQGQQIERWIKDWKGGAALINPSWFPEDNRTFSVLQYVSLTEEQLRAKLAQVPRGTKLVWQFWQPGQISPPVSMAVQETLYEIMRGVAEKNGATLGKANHP